jgi:hypothetical protein
MLPFELSVIDMVLIIAVIILLSFHITKTSNESNTRPKLNMEKKKSSKKWKKKNAISRTSLTDEEAIVKECSYNFGYLSTLPKGKSIPEECYYCSRIMQCLFTKKK